MKGVKKWLIMVLIICLTIPFSLYFLDMTLLGMIWVKVRAGEYLSLCQKFGPAGDYRLLADTKGNRYYVGFGKAAGEVYELKTIDTKLYAFWFSSPMQTRRRHPKIYEFNIKNIDIDFSSLVSGIGFYSYKCSVDATFSGYSDTTVLFKDRMEIIFEKKPFRKPGVSAIRFEQ